MACYHQVAENDITAVSNGRYYIQVEVFAWAKVSETTQSQAPAQHGPAKRFWSNSLLLLPPISLRSALQVGRFCTGQCLPHEPKTSCPQRTTDKSRTLHVSRPLKTASRCGRPARTAETPETFQIWVTSPLVARPLQSSYRRP